RFAGQLAPAASVTRRLTAPTRIDPDLEAVLTDEIRLSLEHAFMPDLVGNIALTWSGADDHYSSIPLYRDADGNEILTTADDVRADLIKTGDALWTNTDRSIEYFGMSAAVTKRLSDRWMLRAHFAYNNWEWGVEPELRRVDYPTHEIIDNVSFFSWSTDDDSFHSAELSSDTGDVDSSLNSRYSFTISGLYQLPWDFNISAHINGREGYPLAFGFYDEGTLGTFSGSVDARSEAPGRSRAEDLITTDVRLDKEVRFGDVGVTLSVDVFNLFNEGFVLQREAALSSDPNEPGHGGFIDQIIGPRVARLGVRLSWK
ncbi:MAG: hypothetical protein AAFY88_03625, partial [Acidobacteriota bacterium]